MTASKKLDSAVGGAQLDNGQLTASYTILAVAAAVAGGVGEAGKSGIVAKESGGQELAVPSADKSGSASEVGAWARHAWTASSCSRRHCADQTPDCCCRHRRLYISQMTNTEDDSHCGCCNCAEDDWTIGWRWPRATLLRSRMSACPAANHRHETATVLRASAAPLSMLMTSETGVPTHTGPSLKASREPEQTGAQRDRRPSRGRSHLLTTSRNIQPTALK